MSTDRSIVVVAHWRTTPQSFPLVLSLMSELRERSLAEPGCLGYEAGQGLAGEATLTIVEKYRDEQAIEAHRQSSHYKEIVAGVIVPLLVDRQVELLQARPPAA